MRLGWILASIVLLALLSAPDSAVGDDVAKNSRSLTSRIPSSGISRALLSITRTSMTKL